MKCNYIYYRYNHIFANMTREYKFRVHATNMYDKNIDNLNNTMSILHSCLNEYVKDNDSFDSLLANLMINSPYYDINGLIDNLKIKQSTDIFQGKVFHLIIQSSSCKFDTLNILLANKQNIFRLYFIM